MLVSICGTARMPPVLFKKSALDMILEENSAIRGQILFERLNPETVQLNPEDALDVDTPEDLVEVARILMSRKMWTAVKGDASEWRDGFRALNLNLLKLFDKRLVNAWLYS